ncbi:MAG: efflux RND transporter periplasmic adaptor subunit [Anaerolineaceae bacterium]|nr:efflux RND transporter periplasmic adaptor subunit [Anaerolineaceae bacterium]
MDHKIEVQKKSAWGPILIVLLILLIIAAAGTFLIMRLALTAQLIGAEAMVNSLSVTTTRVKEGVFELTLNNVTGTVRSGQYVNMNWQTGGTVSEVLVKVGDQVQKGQVLAYLDETTLDQDVLNAKLDIVDAKNDYDTLINNSEKIASTLSTLVKAQQKLEDAQKKLDSMDMTRITDVNLTIARDTAALAQVNYEEALQKFEAVRDAPLDSPGRIKALGDVGGYRSVRDNALAQYNWYLGEIDQLELQSREAAVELAKAELEEAEYQYKKALNGPTAAELMQAQAKIDAYQTKIDSSKIIAPFSGTVTQIDTKPGDVITYDLSSAARNIFAMRIDDISTFYMDFTVSELYINNIKKGMPVRISFAAIPNKVFNGVVYNVSDVGKQSGWNISFDVTIALTNPDEDIKAGMTADITLEIARVENAKYVPQTAVLVEDGKYFVNLKKISGEMQKVPVEIGLISGKNVQIISDVISGGDEIELDVYKTSTPGFNFWGSFSSLMGGGGNTRR